MTLKYSGQSARCREPLNGTDNKHEVSFDCNLDIV